MKVNTNDLNAKFERASFNFGIQLDLGNYFFKVVDEEEIWCVGNPIDYPANPQIHNKVIPMIRGFVVDTNSLKVVKGGDLTKVQQFNEKSGDTIAGGIGIVDEDLSLFTKGASLSLEIYEAENKKGVMVKRAKFTPISKEVVKEAPQTDEVEIQI